MKRFALLGIVTALTLLLAACGSRGADEAELPTPVPVFTRAVSADATPAGELGDHSYFAYLRMDEIDEYYAQVAANGARILKKPRSEPWGMREFALQTIDGHRITVGMAL